MKYHTEQIYNRKNIIFDKIWHAFSVLSAET